MIWLIKNNIFLIYAALVTSAENIVTEIVFVYFLFLQNNFSLTHQCSLRKQTRCISLSHCLSFFVTGKDCQPRMCITTAAPTIGGTTWCLSPSVSTARMMFISLRTATLTPTPVCNITWPAWSAEISITCSESSWASVWLVTACLHTSLLHVLVAFQVFLSVCIMLASFCICCTLHSHFL